MIGTRAYSTRFMGSCQFIVFVGFVGTGASDLSFTIREKPIINNDTNSISLARGYKKTADPEVSGYLMGSLRLAPPVLITN
jgi:hypothetical protein